MASRPSFSRLAERAARLAGLLFALWLCVSFSGPSVSAQTVKERVASGAEPIVVTARSLVADNRKRTVVYKTGVVVKRGAVTLYADEVVVRLNDAGKPDGGEDELFSGSGGVESIEASGGVRIVQGDRTATAARAFYNTADEEIVLSGEPRMWQGKNILTGSSIRFNIADDTISVEDARTVLYQEDGGRADGAK